MTYLLLQSSIIFSWLESLSDVLTPTGFETSFKILTGTEMIERLRLINITSSTLTKYKVSLMNCYHSFVY